MDEARAAGAPQLGQYRDQTIEAAAPPVPEPRGASHRRAMLRWVGIGGCVLVVCGLLGSWLVWPQSAPLLGRWLAAEPSGAAARADPVVPGSPQTVMPGAADG